MMANYAVSRLTPVIVLTLVVHCTIIQGQSIQGQGRESDVINKRDQQTQLTNNEDKKTSDRCNRLPVFPAQCRPDGAQQSTRSWFYDAVSATCRQSPFVGCSLTGNSENSFETWEECRDICVGQDDRQAQGTGAVTMTTGGDDVTSTTMSQSETGTTTTSMIITSDDVTTGHVIAADFIEGSDEYSTVSQLRTIDTATENSRLKDNESSPSFEIIISVTEDNQLESNRSSSNIEKMASTLADDELGEIASSSKIDSTTEEYHHGDNASSSAAETEHSDIPDDENDVLTDEHTTRPNEIAIDEHYSSPISVLLITDTSSNGQGDTVETLNVTDVLEDDSESRTSLVTELDKKLSVRTEPSGELNAPEKNTLLPSPSTQPMTTPPSGGLSMQNIDNSDHYESQSDNYAPSTDGHKLSLEINKVNNPQIHIDIDRDVTVTRDDVNLDDDKDVRVTPGGEHDSDVISSRHDVPLYGNNDKMGHDEEQDSDVNSTPHDVTSYGDDDERVTMTHGGEHDSDVIPPPHDVTSHGFNDKDITITHSAEYDSDVIPASQDVTFYGINDKGVTMTRYREHDSGIISPARSVTSYGDNDKSVTMSRDREHDSDAISPARIVTSYENSDKGVTVTHDGNLMPVPRDVLSQFSLDSDVMPPHKDTATMSPNKDKTTPSGKRTSNLLNIVRMVFLSDTTDDDVTKDNINDVTDDVTDDVSKDRRAGSRRDDVTDDVSKDRRAGSRRAEPSRYNRRLSSYQTLRPKYAKTTPDGAHTSSRDLTKKMTSASSERAGRNLCQLPVVLGFCFKRIQRWYYDVTSGSCRPFIYSGCGGNKNNFDDVDECMHTCDKSAHLKPTCTGSTCISGTTEDKLLSPPQRTDSKLATPGGGGIEAAGIQQRAMHTLTIMMPVQLNEGRVDNHHPVFEDRNRNERNDVVNRGERQFQQQAHDDVMNTLGSQLQQQSIDLDNWNLQSAANQRFFLPALLAAQMSRGLGNPMSRDMSRDIPLEQRNVRTSESKERKQEQQLPQQPRRQEQQQQQQQQSRRQAVTRRPDSLVKNDVMMASISYGLVGPQARGMMSPPDFSITDLPMNTPNYRPMSRPLADREHDNEKIPFDWRQRMNSMERQPIGKSRKRGPVQEDQPQYRMREDRRLERPRELMYNQPGYENRLERPRTKKPQKSKSHKSSSRKSQQSKKISRKQSRQEQQSRERFADNEDRLRPFPMSPSFPANDKMTLFQVVVRRQQELAHHGFPQPMPFMPRPFNQYNVPYVPRDDSNQYNVQYEQPRDLTNQYNMPSVPRDEFNQYNVQFAPPRDLANQYNVAPVQRDEFNQYNIQYEPPRDMANQYNVQYETPRDVQTSSFFQAKEKFIPQQTPDSDDSSPPVIVITSDVNDDLVQPSYVCFLPRDIGNCKSYQNKWYFNVNTGQCEMFFYGGCGGNANRFNDVDTCRQTCTPNDFKPTNQESQPSVGQGQGQSDVTQTTGEQMTEADTTTSEPLDVIYVTSPVYVPMTMEDADADTETESIPSDVIISTTTPDQSQSTTTTTAVVAAIEQTTELGHHVISSQVLEQSAISGLSTQYIAIVSVLGAVGLAVIILVVITVTHMCRKVHKSKKVAAVEEVIKTHMYGDLPQVVYSQATVVSNKFDEKL